MRSLGVSPEKVRRRRRRGTFNHRNSSACALRLRFVHGRAIVYCASKLTLRIALLLLIRAMPPYERLDHSYIHTGILSSVLPGGQYYGGQSRNFWASIGVLCLLNFIPAYWIISSSKHRIGLNVSGITDHHLRLRARPILTE